LAKIWIQPKKFRGFGGVPKVDTEVTLHASGSEYLATQTAKT